MVEETGAKAEVTAGFVSTFRHPSTGSGTKLNATQAQRIEGGGGEGP